MYMEFEYVERSTYIKFEYVKQSTYIEYEYVFRVICLKKQYVNQKYVYRGVHKSSFNCIAAKRGQTPNLATKSMGSS
jgi:hypothetical protein